VLGYLNPETFEAGFRLDREAAERAIATHIGAPLGVSTVQAAQAIVDVSANHMASAIRQVTLEHGVDPRGALLVAGGGAGAMVAAALADLLEADKAVIPATAGVLAAYGAHEAPIATEFTTPHHIDTGDYDGPSAGRVLDSLDARADAFVTRFATPETSVRRSYFVDARYPAQAWDLRVHLDERPAQSEGGARAIADAFHREHLHRNGTEDPGSRVEILAWGVRAELGQDGEHLPSLAAPWADGSARTDEVVFGSRAERTPRYAVGALAPKQVVIGPAIIDEPTTTVVIPPGWVARLDDQRNFHLQRDREAA
jgi:N-methylhydantoinase A